MSTFSNFVLRFVWISCALSLSYVRWVLPAYIRGSEFGRQLGRLLTYSGNSKRPKIVPWGTPQLKVQLLKKKPLMEHIWVPSSKYDWHYWCIINSYSSRTRRIWADNNQRGRSKFSSNSLDFFGWNLLKSWHFLYRRRRENFFSDLQNFSTRNSPSVFPYLVKLNDNGSYHGPIGNQSESWKIIILS